MTEAGKGDLGGPGTPADRVAALEHADGEPDAGQGDCGGEAVRPRPDDGDVEVGHDATGGMLGADISRSSRSTDPRHNPDCP